VHVLSESNNECYSILIEEGFNVEIFKIFQVTDHEKYSLVGINDSLEVLKKRINERKEVAYFLCQRETKEVTELIQCSNCPYECVDIVSDSNKNKQVILIQRYTYDPDIIDLNLFLIKGGKVLNRLVQTIRGRFDQSLCPILSGNLVTFTNNGDIHCFDMKSKKCIYLNQLPFSKMLFAANFQEELDGFVIWKREEKTNEAGKMLKLKSFKA